jgi:pimeloyl-ACP methyl ester carboxylesterase
MLRPGWRAAAALPLLSLSLLGVGCASPAVRAPGDGTRIEDARFVRLGGLAQWITVRGDDDRKPLLLVVHGGPGDVQSPFVSSYALYERDFVVVQWDQRGAGRTYQRYGAATPGLTLDRLAEDGVELARYLRARFPRRDLVVLGHSWGSAIATEMVRRRPALFAAYVGTGQIASWAESVQAQFEHLRERARATGDAGMRAELDAIGRPDPMDAEQYFSFTRPLRRFLCASDAAWLAGLLPLVRRAPGMTEETMRALIEGAAFSGRTLLPTQMRIRLSSDALRFDVPYLVIQGRDDLFTPTAPAEAYFREVQAPRKQIVVIEGAGHFALVTHAPAFLEALRGFLAPRRGPRAAGRSATTGICTRSSSSSAGGPARSRRR